MCQKVTDWTKRSMTGRVTVTVIMVAGIVAHSVSAMGGEECPGPRWRAVFRQIGGEWDLEAALSL